MSIGFRFFDRLYLKLRRNAGRGQRARALADQLSVQGPQLLEPPAGRILVLAPHPDDESIGAGGLILSISDRAERVAIALFTGGEQGRVDWQAQQTAAVRGQEMQQCLAVLGLTSCYPLGGHDQHLMMDAGLPERLAEVLRQFKPEHVALPCFCDGHLDHRHVNELFLTAAANVGFAGTVWGYEVWTPCPANVAIDISRVAEAKGRAIEVHTSQNSVMHYRQAALGLNSYRAMQVNWRGSATLTHAEAYFRASFADYAMQAQCWFAQVDGAASSKTQGATP